jgi:hypothetical protein
MERYVVHRSEARSGAVMTIHQVKARLRRGALRVSKRRTNLRREGCGAEAKDRTVEWILDLYPAVYQADEV